MMFLEQDEYIIIMEDLFSPFSSEDIKRVEEAGIKTVYVSTSIWWDKLHHSFSMINWTDLDKRLEKLLNSNLKLLLPFYYTTPSWFPDSWYIHKHKLATHILPNFGNTDFEWAVDNFADEILEHYSEYKDRIQLTFSIPSGGEFLWDAVQTSNYPMSDEMIINFVLNRQRHLVKQHGEVWTHLHNFLGDPMNWNNTHLPVLYQAIRDEFPDVPFYSIQFAHFTCGHLQNRLDGQFKVKEYTEKFGIKFYVGSDYCEGLTTNFDALAEQKAWGFFTCPMHSENLVKHTSIEPWMVDTLRTTNEKIKEVWNGRD